MKRPVGVVTALSLAAVVSLFGTSLSVGRQPVPVPTLDPRSFTVIIPPSPSGPAAPFDAEASAATIVDFHDAGSALTRVDAGVPSPPRHLVQPRPTPAPKVVTAAVPKTRPVAAVGSVAPVAPAPTSSGQRVSGLATWFCLPGVSACTSGYTGGMYAAAGAEIRIGNWRGRTVKVCGNGNCIYVKLIDWCGCPGSRIIDLYHDAFSKLASPSKGYLAVTVSW